MQRRPALPPARPLVFALLLLAPLASGCSDRMGPGDPSQSLGDSRFAALAPGAHGPPASLKNIWPNEDGRSWTYRLDQRVWDIVDPTTYPTPEEVPPIPSLDEVAALLGNHPIGSNPVPDAAGYRMQFRGMKTTQSGAIGQNLETEVFDLATTASGSVRHSVVPDAGFWRSLARARPDLAPRIAGRLQQDAARLAAPVGAETVDPPLYLFGYAWEKTREYIGSYGDLNTILSWKYLEADLTPGHEFTIQLIPDLADNVFLHVRVLAERTAATVLGEYPHSIDVLYVVDYGVGDYAGGSVPGFAHAYDYGTITYAPKVGPVASYERNIIYTGEPIHPGYRELRGEVAAVVPGRGPLP